PPTKPGGPRPAPSGPRAEQGALRVRRGAPRYGTARGGEGSSPARPLAGGRTQPIRAAPDPGQGVGQAPVRRGARATPDHPPGMGAGTLPARAGSPAGCRSCAVRRGNGRASSRSVRDFPVFVPWRGEHLAAVVAVPEGRPRGLAVFSSVPGSPRTHRHQVWARAAERLGDRGIASVRFEFVGLDDSTGTSVEVSMAVSPLDQILAVTRFAQRAVGVDPLVAAGNCLGAQAALALAAELPECTGAVCMLPPAVRSGAVWG